MKLCNISKEIFIILIIICLVIYIFNDEDKEKFIKASSSGVVRGCIMGLLIDGVYGAITTGAVFAVINPITLCF